MPDHLGSLRKFATFISRPKTGQVFVNKSSLNLNIYLGRASLFGKILIWSPRNKGRWITSTWFRGHHRRVFTPTKDIVLIEFDAAVLSDKTQLEQTKILKDPETESRLMAEINRVEMEKDSLYLGPPLDFSIFLIMIVIAFIFGLPLLIVALAF